MNNSPPPQQVDMNTNNINNDANMSGNISPNENSDMEDNVMYSSPSSGQDLSQSELMKMRKPIFRVKKACVNCAKAHACCSTYRPCRRCLQRGLVCWDTKPKKRGPKRRVKSNSNVSSPAPEGDGSISSGDSNSQNSMLTGSTPDYNPNPKLNHHLQSRPTSSTSQQAGSSSNGSSDSSNQNGQSPANMQTLPSNEMFAEHINNMINNNKNNNWRGGTLSPNAGNPGGMPLSYQHHYSQHHHLQAPYIANNHPVMGNNSQFTSNNFSTSPSSSTQNSNVPYQFDQKPNFEKGPLFPSRLQSTSNSNFSSQKPLPGISTSASRIPPQFSKTPHSQMSFNPPNQNLAYPRSVMEQPLRKVSISNLANNSTEHQQLPPVSNLQDASMPFQRNTLSSHQQQHLDYFSSRQPNNSKPSKQELPNISKSLGMNAFRNFANNDKPIDNDSAMPQSPIDNNSWTSKASEMYKDLVMGKQDDPRRSVNNTNQN
eukprot:gb/GECH01014327.1/.p1 GENE.gb/GECH01014327.1/~~gb/GECH01014327.1/.p1  ORF type:complete len:484 (+),score=112.00 gb/GECH01014327.1/:1-1452(+)